MTRRLIPNMPKPDQPRESTGMGWVLITALATVLAYTLIGQGWLG